MSTCEAFSYDSVPYPSFTFPQSGPIRLATLAAYHGMAPAEPENCRVLELGCGNGANLMSFAHILTKSEFVGVDLSNVHIADARESAESLGIKNVRFEQQDIADFDFEEFGSFDYIIAQGVFSWVPQSVREKLLEIYDKSLRPNGVGYISYNTYPGFHFREMLRGMMKFHVRNITAPDEMVRKGVELLNTIGSSIGSSPYQQILLSEYSKMPTRWTANIYHDEFSDINDAFYFHEVAEMFRTHGLQYLSECSPEPQNELSSEAISELGIDTADPIELEQYRDFLICRRFRSSLVCRDSVQIDRKPCTDVVKSSFIISRLQAQGDLDFVSGAPVKFADSKGVNLEVNHPLTIAALAHLEGIWASSAGFDDLIANAWELMGGEGAPPEDQVEITATYFLKMFENELVALSKFRPIFSTVVTARPVASPFARWQILRGSDNVTTLTGMNIEIDNDLIKHLIVLLDGTNGRVELFTEIMSRAEVPDSDRNEYWKALPGLIESSLTDLAKCGLLIDGD